MAVTNDTYIIDQNQVLSDIILHLVPYPTFGILCSVFIWTKFTKNEKAMEKYWRKTKLEKAAVAKVVDNKRHDDTTMSP